MSAMCCAELGKFVEKGLRIELSLNSNGGSSSTMLSHSAASNSERFAIAAETREKIP